MILFVAIGGSYGAHLLGFSYSLGAFAAGMMIAETKYRHQAEADLVPFRDLLLGIFFITVGMQIDFGLILKYIHIIAILLLSIMLLKFSIIYLLAKPFNNQRTTIKTALALVQVGEFALAILELARTKSLIASPYGQIIIVTIVISMILTPLILKHLSAFADFIIKQDIGILEHEFQNAGARDHIVVLGYGEFGKSITKELKDKKETYIVIENNIDQYRIAKEKKEMVIFGNAANKEILKKRSSKMPRKS